MFLISTVNFSIGSFVPKNKSTEVRFIPDSSTVKDCANGSLPPLPRPLPLPPLPLLPPLLDPAPALDPPLLLGLRLLRFLPPPPPLRLGLGGGGGTVSTIVLTVTS